jgi:DNA polymerase III gamma/tau subunit
VINRLNGFFSSEHWLINRWQLPLAGLLLTVGLATTISTLQAAPGQKGKAAKSTVSSATIAPSFETKVPQLSEPAVNSTTVAPIEEAAPLQSEQAVNPTTVAPSFDATAPQLSEQAVNSTPVAPSFDATVSQPSEQAIDSTTAAPTDQAAVPQKTKKAMNSATGASAFKAAASHKPGSGVDSKSEALPSVKWNRQAQETSKATIAQVPATDAQIPDGTYLYGQSSQPQQNGKEYMVFEARQGKVVGALYLPNSEYSCFYGTLDSRKMNLTVVNPYNQTAFSHTIARSQPAQIAAAGGQINLENTYDSLSYPYAVGLEGYQPIGDVSANDKQLLSTCLSEYQAKFGN